MDRNKIIIAALAGGLIAAGSLALRNTRSSGMSKNEFTLRTAMNKLWSDHVLWTRQFIVSSVASLPDVPNAAARLMKNQEDIGAAIVPYYGKQAGDTLTMLLKAHIQVAANIVAAAMAKDEAKMTELNKVWHQNAAQIATFLSKANPNWNQEALYSMLNEHLQLTANELVNRLSKNWPADVTNFDKVFDQALMMAKDLSDGIVKQFPDKFN